MPASTSGDVEAGLEDLRSSLRQSLDLPHHEYAGRAYTNLAETAYQLHRYDELAAWIDAGAQFAADHDLPGHLYNLEAHRALLLLNQGHWDEAQAGWDGWSRPSPEPDQLTRLTLPPLGRLLARRGDDRAAALLDRAWDLAVRNGSLAALAPAGLAVIESAWLAGDIQPADEQITVLLERTTTPGRSQVPGRAAALSGSGRPGGPRSFDGCPPEWAAGIAGDWQQAADDWRKIGDPYEQALELAAAAEPRPPAWRRSTSSTAWVRPRRPVRSGPRCASSASPASPAAANEPRGKTRPASPIARSTCWPCSRPG